MGITLYILIGIIVTLAIITIIANRVWKYANNILDFQLMKIMSVVEDWSLLLIAVVLLILIIVLYVNGLSGNYLYH